MPKHTQTEKSPDRYLTIREEKTSRGYGEQWYHLRGRIECQKWNATTYRHEPDYLDSDLYGDGLLVSPLKISAQGDNDTRQKPIDRALYGYHCEYRDVHDIDTRKARRMLKTLEHIDRGLEKLRATRGNVQTFGDYCGRIAIVLKCKGIAVERDAYDHETRGRRIWTWNDIGEGIDHINRLILQWQHEGRPKPEPTRYALPESTETEQAS